MNPWKPESRLFHVSADSIACSCGVWHKGREATPNLTIARPTGRRLYRGDLVRRQTGGSLLLVAQKTAASTVKLESAGSNRSGPRPRDRVRLPSLSPPLWRLFRPLRSISGRSRVANLAAGPPGTRRRPASYSPRSYHASPASKRPERGFVHSIRHFRPSRASVNPEVARRNPGDCRTQNTPTSTSVLYLWLRGARECALFMTKSHLDYLIGPCAASYLGSSPMPNMYYILDNRHLTEIGKPQALSESRSKERNRDSLGGRS